MFFESQFLYFPFWFGVQADVEEEESERREECSVWLKRFYDPRCFCILRKD